MANTIILIVCIVLALVVVAMAVVLRFDRRQNRIVDAKLIEQVERNLSLEEQVRTLGEKIHAHELQNALLASENEALRSKAEQDKQQLEQLQASFRTEFKNLANDILDEKQKSMTATNKEAIDLILKPLRDNITEFRTRIETIYSAQNEQTGALKAELKNLMELNSTITAETKNLTRALKGDSKVQGDWGEMILDSLLEHSGLQKGIHYSTQESIKDDKGRNQRPDVVLSLPEGKQIIIDSKVSLTAYTEWCGAEDEAQRNAAMSSHITSVTKHVQELAAKRYQDLLAKAPEFVIMFVPNEPAFMCALQNSPNLWSDAYKRNVVISSPTNLLAMLRIVYDLWQRDTQNKNALQIADAGGKLYDKVVGFVDTLGEVDKNIRKASESCSKAMEQLSTGRGNILSRVEGLRTLGAKAAKRLPEHLVATQEEESEE
ncbi:MAG: DNA recombination protein RmuC [Rikenellaceae bacterium]|nr:DNA recombination protein RmuC [Rikenellaceae bacterium]